MSEDFTYDFSGLTERAKILCAVCPDAVNLFAVTLEARLDILVLKGPHAYAKTRYSLIRRLTPIQLAEFLRLTVRDGGPDDWLSFLLEDA